MEVQLRIQGTPLSQAQLDEVGRKYRDQLLRGVRAAEALKAAELKRARRAERNRRRAAHQEITT